MVGEKREMGLRWRDEDWGWRGGKATNRGEVEGPPGYGELLAETTDDEIEVVQPANLIVLQL